MNFLIAGFYETVSAFLNAIEKSNVNFLKSYE
jgi:hypothetical protein